MKTRTTLYAPLLALALLTAACSSDTEASPEACKAAMVDQLKEATETGKEGSRPAACDGLDDKTLESLAGEASKEWLDSSEAEKTVEDAADDALDATSEPPAPAEPIPADTGIPDECRAWIESEMLDTTEEVDGTAGAVACGDLTDEEMDQALEDITNELIEEGATIPAH
ncbi:hypothetical protein ACFXAZ_12150 [Streptomyces sp. NPDC059477]|uniref:hypothetical protein n=1 Tax=Streptomyces sp. NPDC059477 TaxID=3346847 RepID=UPI0036C994D7